MSSKKTVVLGASENPNRYSFLAVNSLLNHDHPVVAIGKQEGKIKNVPIHKGPVQEENVDTVTLYLNPSHQKQYYDFIFSLNPKRLIFNPGTENPELASLARNQGIQPINACTLVMLSTGQY